MKLFYVVVCFHFHLDYCSSVALVLDVGTERCCDCDGYDLCLYLVLLEETIVD